jgi:hypothetical protein
MRARSVIAITVLLLFGVDAARCADTDIRLNSLGFLPKMQKKATIVSPCSAFTVKKAPGGQVVYSGAATGPLHQDDVGQDVWVADFSAVGEKGKFYLDVPGVGRSFEFEIGDAVYDFAFTTAMRSFYLWRCGTAVAGEHNGLRYAHAASDAVAHLFGRNYYGRSYVTGLGRQPPRNPHDRRSGADGIEAPWPGYVVGGGQSAKGWNDTQADYRTNEIAINWQAALVYALACLTSGQSQ